ncbi:MAG: RluA family pseudouridine synthase [Lachnospiraceae bacterium]|jgi:23S rRNA pseudouridine1911/1915/1917 synthase|nr:RluA family pseudouridine synthase [Lachnospiraceae bacterium]
MKTEIIYEDGELLVVWKPAGLATQTAKTGQADVVSELKNYLARTAPGKGAPYLGIIHRLDQPVEGMLVFAKKRSAAAALTAQLGGQGNAGLMNKQYYAVLCGKPVPEEGELVDYLRKGTDGRAQVAGKGPGHPQEPAGKPAILSYRVLQTVAASSGDELSLADIRIETGRFHQIRAQMANAGVPLLGDVKYGNERTGAAAQRLGVRTVALCAYRLELVHPVSGKLLQFEKMPQTRGFSFFSLSGEQDRFR